MTDRFACPRRTESAVDKARSGANTFILKKIRRLTGDINLTEVAQRTFKYSFSSYSLLT